MKSSKVFLKLGGLLSDAQFGLLSNPIYNSPPYRHSQWKFSKPPLPPLIATPHLLNLRLFQPPPPVYCCPLLFQTGEYLPSLSGTIGRDL